MENNSKRIAAMVIAGLAAGAATWYLMKTENGKENWSAIIDAVKDFNDKVKSKAAEGVDKLAHLTDKASDAVTDKAKKVSDASENAKDFISDRAQKAAQTTEKAADFVAHKAKKVEDISDIN
jgi:gas vesicle protein